MKNLIVCVLLVGCSHQTHTVGGITSIARQNTILAYNDYVGESLSITGLVIDVGVDSSLERGLIQAVDDDEKNVYVFIEGNKDLYPFVVLGDSLESYDVAICFFEYNGSDQASHFRVGMNVNVNGKVYRFVKIGERTVVVLRMCGVE